MDFCEVCNRERMQQSEILCCRNLNSFPKRLLKYDSPMRLKLDMRSLSSKPNYVTDLFCHLVQFPHSLRDCFVPPVSFHSWVHWSILALIYYLHCNQVSSRETWFGVAVLCQFLAAVSDILFEFYLMFYIYVKRAPKTAKTIEKSFASQAVFSLQLSMKHFFIV